eukprot:scaffold868_cov249-Pinguiococcus_pyrenoidosus.AAC.15
MASSSGSSRPARHASMIELQRRKLSSADEDAKVGDQCQSLLRAPSLDADGAGEAAEGVDGVCRICSEGTSAGPLVRPCKCTGTMGNVHLTCLARWVELRRAAQLQLGQVPAHRRRHVVLAAAGRPAGAHGAQRGDHGHDSGGAVLLAASCAAARPHRDRHGRAAERSAAVVSTAALGREGRTVRARRDAGAAGRRTGTLVIDEPAMRFSKTRSCI